MNTWGFIILLAITLVDSSVILQGLSTEHTTTDHTIIKTTATKKVIQTEAPVKEKEIHTKKDKKHIENADSSHACQFVNNQKSCLSITEYSISPNYTLYCKTKHLEIVFEYLDVITHKNSLASLFLTTNGSLQKSQEISKVCYKIRKYYVNWHTSILFLINKLHLLDNADINDVLDLELYNYSFRLWLLHKSSLYDEENDAFKFIEFVKINGLILIFSILIYFAFKILGFIVSKYFDKLYIQHCNKIAQRQIELSKNKKGKRE